MENPGFYKISIPETIVPGTVDTSLHVQYKAVYSIINDDDDLWRTKNENFHSLDALIESMKNSFWKDSTIYLEIFNPLRQEWQSIISFNFEAAKYIEEIE